MKKSAIASLVTIFMLAGFFYFGNVPAANALSQTNASADFAIGQPDLTSNSPNQGLGPHPAANTLAWPVGSWTDGKKLIVADLFNSRVLIYNNFPTSSNASADVVVGQVDMNSFSPSSASANSLGGPYSVFSDGVRLFITDGFNSRVLIYNTIPTVNNATADVVVGQPDFTSDNDNQGQADAAANTLSDPTAVFSDGKKLFIADTGNNRVLVYNSIPTSNNASADYVIGQPNLTSNMENRGDTTARPDSLSFPSSVFAHSGKLIIADSSNYRVLIYNSIPSANGASADVAVGQTSLGAASDNQGGSPGPNTLGETFFAHSDGSRLYITDYTNQRLLIYNNIPTSNNISADIVLGQANFSGKSANQGGNVAANTLAIPSGVYFAAGKLMVGDTGNSRVLAYSLDAARSWRNKKAISLYGGIKGKIVKNKISFSGKNSSIKKGRVYVYQNGVLKKSIKGAKSGKWSLKYSDKQRSVSRTFQFRYYNSYGHLVSVSDAFNLYLTGLNGQSLSEKPLSGSDSPNAQLHPANSISSPENVTNAMNFLSAHWKIK